jgi:hypothetical protein
MGMERQDPERSNQVGHRRTGGKMIQDKAQFQKLESEQLDLERKLLVDAGWDNAWDVYHDESHPDFWRLAFDSAKQLIDAEEVK